MDVLYFECHITIEPVFDEKRMMVQKICLPFKFKVADLLMKKRTADSEQRSQNDTFTTSRSASLDEMYDRMIACAEALTANGFKVWRHKIEAVVFDQKFK